MIRVYLNRFGFNSWFVTLWHRARSCKCLKLHEGGIMHLLYETMICFWTCYIICRLPPRVGLCSSSICRLTEV